MIVYFRVVTLLSSFADSNALQQQGDVIKKDGCQVETFNISYSQYKMLLS